MSTSSTARPPRENLIRAAMPGNRGDSLDSRIEFRADGEDDGPVMFGHFSVFDQWTEINSMWEGNFLERVVKGAYKKTFREQRSSMRCLFQHGMDPQIGDKPLGPIRELREDDIGAYYEVPLLDAAYVRETILPGLKEDLYGASFRFRVVREEWVDEPEPSDHNPKGLPERSIKEASVSEFGAVTFPAYEGATAGVRSMTDDFIMRCFARDPERLRSMFDNAQRLDTFVQQHEGDTTSPDGEPRTEEERGTKDPTAPPKDGAEQRAHPVHGRRDTSDPLYGLTPRKEQPAWLL